MVTFENLVLNGLSYQRAALMGLPHWHCTDSGLILGSPCAICGGRATNAHHVVPKGMGGGSLEIRTRQGKVLRSPLVAVCGMGNASGCHGRLHAGLEPRPWWVWRDADARRLWETGDIWQEFDSQDVRLNDLGEWRLVKGEPGRGFGIGLH